MPLSFQTVSGCRAPFGSICSERLTLTIEPTSRSVLSEIRISPPADDHLAGVDADAHLDLRQSPLPISRVQAAHGLLHGHRAREGALGVVRRRCGRPEDDED